MSPVPFASPLSAERAQLPDVGRFFAVDLWQLTPLSALAVLCFAAYLLGAIRLWRSGRGWSPVATLSFGLGCLAWFAATGATVSALADELVFVLLFQQLTLMVVAPPLLMIGSPGRLLLRATPHRGLGLPALRLAHAGYRSPVSRALLHPAVAVIVPLLCFPALYFTDAISWVMAMPSGHSVLLVVLLVLGIIAGAPLWSRDPLPRTPSYVVRLAGVFLEIQIHAIFGLILLLSTGPRFAWYADDPGLWGLTRGMDHAIAGGLVWSYGELPLLIVLIVILSKWRNRDLRTARHRQEEEDAELDRYNAALAAQHAADAADTASGPGR